jgi:hypothetical protein
VPASPPTEPLALEALDFESAPPRAVESAAVPPPIPIECPLPAPRRRRWWAALLNALQGVALARRGTNQLPDR